jgi:hypothetical protein
VTIGVQTVRITATAVFAGNVTDECAVVLWPVLHGWR